MYLSKGPIFWGFITCLAILFTTCRDSGTGAVVEKAEFKIEAVSPIQGKFGTEIIISGYGFSETPSENSITINGVSADVRSATTRFLKTVIPKGAGTGPVKVQVYGKTASGPSFIYKPTIHVSTLAGSGELGFRDGEGAQARFNYPVGLELTKTGDLIVVDYWNHSIRAISPDGWVSTIAGDGQTGIRDGEGTDARFFRPIDVEIASDGSLLISDFGNHRIRHINPSGFVTTLAGTTEGYNDGLPNVAQFSFPAGIAVTEDDVLYVSDSGNNRIRRITTEGKVSTYAGSGEFGFENGYGQMAAFRFPFGMDVGNNERIFVADYGNNSIRLISSDDFVSTFSGNGEAGYQDDENDEAQFNAPYDVTVDKNNRIYVADFYNHRIRRISPKREVINIAGTGEPGLVNGDETQARFNGPIGLALNDQGTVLYVADHHNQVIRKITIE